MELKYEEEITARHTSDMTSDDKWSKRIRPFSMAYLLGVVSILAVTDGNITWGEYQFIINPEYVELFKALLMTAFAFYFGGRSLEKIQSTLLSLNQRRKRRSLQLVICWEVVVQVGLRKQ